MRRTELALTISLLAGCGATKPASIARLESDSDVADMPAYDSILDRARNLERGGAGVKVVEYGKSGKGKALSLVRIGRDDGAPAANRPAVLMTEATHGNEYLGVGHELLPWLAEQARSGTNDFFRKGGVVLVVPVINPDGYEYHRLTAPDQRAQDGGPDGGNSWGRMNAHRVDLNRDFRVKGAGFDGFREPESKALADGIDKALAGASLRVSVDYHCCIGEGALLYSYAFSESQRLPKADEDRVRHFGGMLQRELQGSELDTSPNLAGYAAIGTTIDYFYETYKTAAITFEGKHGGETSRMESHRLAWGAILADLAKELPEPQGGGTGDTGDADVKVALRGDGEALAFAVATSGAKSVSICAGAAGPCVALQKSLQRNGREVRYDDATLAVPAGGLLTAVVERADGRKSSTAFRVSRK